MELKDYLHYYMGCKCKTYAGKGKLTSLDIDSGHWYVSLDTGGGTVGNINDTYRECPEESKQAFPNGYPPKSILKPLLRRLEDMTEREAEKLAMIYSGAVSVKRTKGVAANWHYYNCYFGEGTEGEILTISADGSAWYAHYFDKNQPGCRNIVNEHFATHFLLRQGFDLFGLIPAGLAIDAKKIER